MRQEDSPKMVQFGDRVIYLRQVRPLQTWKPELDVKY